MSNTTPKIEIALALACCLVWLVAGIGLAGCKGSGHATLNADTPIGPVLVDLWWCEEDQCVIATDPADTPMGVPMMAEGVELEVHTPSVTR